MRTQRNSNYLNIVPTEGGFLAYSPKGELLGCSTKITVSESMEENVIRAKISFVANLITQEEIEQIQRENNTQ